MMTKVKPPRAGDEDGAEKGQHHQNEQIERGGGRLTTRCCYSHLVLLHGSDKGRISGRGKVLALTARVELE